MRRIVSTSFFAIGLVGIGCGGHVLPEGQQGDGGPGAASSSGSGSSSGVGSGASSGSSGGASDSGSSGGSGSSSGSSSSSSGSGSGSSGGSFSSSSSSGSGSGAGDVGSITFNQYVSNSASPPTGNSFAFTAAFSTSSAPATCTATITAGSCAFYVCAKPQLPPGVSAGQLTIAGGQLSNPLTVDPMAGTDAYWDGMTGLLLSHGEPMTVTSAGGVVPAFAQSITPPPLLQLNQPPLSGGGGPMIIPTSQDLVLTWDTGEGQPGATLVVEGTTDAESGDNYFTCSFTPTVGTAAVPQLVLAPYAHTGAGYMTVGQYTTTTFSAGSFTVTMTALLDSSGDVEFE